MLPTKTGIMLLQVQAMRAPVCSGFKQDARPAAHAGVPLASSKQGCLQVCKGAGDMHLEGLAHSYQGGRRTACHTIPSRHGNAACKQVYMDVEKLRLVSVASISPVC